jgi:hypothetical protein
MSTLTAGNSEMIIKAMRKTAQTVVHGAQEASDLGQMAVQKFPSQPASADKGQPKNRDGNVR